MNREVIYREEAIKRNMEFMNITKNIYELEKLHGKTVNLMFDIASMNVYPAAGLLSYVGRDVPVYLIDPKDVSVSRRDVHHIMKGASEGLKELTDILLNN